MPFKPFTKSTKKTPAKKAVAKPDLNARLKAAAPPCR